ncbi:MAG: hypothetical protein LBC85_12275 [Fibromonadaceae bacterium]|jgi:hypothetical protein|nr:hypothetical protein [Fibromonadaceae bacterium]
MFETIKNWDEIINNLNQFKKIVDNRNNKAFERLTSFSHWYYFPNESIFAPNKFLRYKNTTLENYKGEGYGDSKDSTLTKYFKRLEENTDEYKELFSELKEFTQKMDKKLNASIKIYVPNGFIYENVEKATGGPLTF